MSNESSVKTVVIGVGPEDGLGAQLCARFLRRGHHVFMAGRTRENLEALARRFGGNATAFVADATDEAQVAALFDAVDAAGRHVETSDLQRRQQQAGTHCRHGIAILRAVLARRRLRRFPVGARSGAALAARRRNADLHGGERVPARPRQLRAFNASKGAQRSLAQAMAKEYAEEGVHVAHVVIDGPIGGEKIKRGAAGVRRTSWRGRHDQHSRHR